MSRRLSIRALSIMSLTLTLSGMSSILAANYSPAIDFSDDDYELGLIHLETYHTIPNVNVSNNKFYFGRRHRNYDSRGVVRIASYK
ncbi:hypothetical protein P5V15_012852 [Pogonomyrmex californicus]